MNKICVLLRVYNRVEDLKYCLQIIRDTWKINSYYVIVVANGINDGHLIDEETKQRIDCLIEIENNIGHFNGNSQLLIAGLKSIPDYCAYTVILEADTWLFGDELIENYVVKLKNQNAVWASAQFWSYITNLATDFAIVDTEFIKSHQEVFNFNGTPEYYIGEYLSLNKFKFIYIKENGPVNTPRYIKKFPFAPTGRFFVFPKSKMVTHHIESLKGGMDEKKLHFNALVDKDYFPVSHKSSYDWIRFKMKASILISYLLPYKSWFTKSPKFYK